jgi:hypothetical protein
MRPRSRWRAGVAAALLAVLAAGLLTASGASSGARAATWTWSTDVPGDPLAAGVSAGGAGAADVRELAAVDDFILLASGRDGQLVVGAADGDHLGEARFEPLGDVAGAQPMIVYNAATPEGAQQEVVGVARADVDHVDATLTDGRVQELPLNEWRGFSYSAADAGDAAVSIVAYAGGASVGAVRLPQTAAQAQSADPAVAPVYGLFRAFLVGQTAVLARVNARTLQPAEPRLQLRTQGAAGIALSPDGGELALVAAAPSHPARLAIVNLNTMQIARTLPVREANTIRALSWPQPDRLIELRQVMKGPYKRNVGSRTVDAIDPATGARIGASTLTNKLSIRGSVSTPAGLVLLLGSSGLHGPNVQLALATPGGRAETVQVPVGARKGVTRSAMLTASSSNGHAYVAVAGGVVFDVDLNTMSLTRHAVTPPPAATKVPPPIGFLQAQVRFAGSKPRSHLVGTGVERDRRPSAACRARGGPWVADSPQRTAGRRCSWRAAPTRPPTTTRTVALR